MTKRKWITIALLLVVVLAGCEALGAGGVISSPANGKDGGEAHTLTVSGRASVSLTPEFAQVSVGVQTESETAELAVAENNQNMENVVLALETFGVASGDIQTGRFRIYPVHNRNSLGEVLSTTFRVENSLSVTVQDLDDLSAILDAVVAVGANTIDGISFKLEDHVEQAAYDQALAAALADARRKADLLAEAAGVEIVDVLTINVSTSSVHATPFELGAAETPAGGVPVFPSEPEISIEVYFVYLIQAVEPAPVETEQVQEGEN